MRLLHKDGVLFIKGVKKEDVEKLLYDVMVTKLDLIFHKLKKGKNVVYRSFDPDRLHVVKEKGTDRTKDYISKYELLQGHDESVLYAGPLYQAIEYGLRYFTKKNRLCLSIYNADKLERLKGEFYAYKPKEGYSFKDALETIVCLEK